MSTPLTILVVSSSTRRPVMESLKDVNARVLAAGSCVEARRLLKQPEAVDLVITDTRLSDGNWYSVLSMVAADDRGPEIVVFSDHEDQDFRDRIRSYGALDLLPAGASLATAGWKSSSTPKAAAASA